MGCATITCNQRGSSAAAAIGAVGAILAAIVSGIFLLASTDAPPPDSTSNPGRTFTIPTFDDPPDFTLPDLDRPDPAVFLSRDSGPGGSTVNVSGEGFEPGERVVLRFHTEQIGSTTASQAGSFSNVAVTIPTSFSVFAPQQFDIVATGDGSARSARAPFTLSG